MKTKNHISTMSVLAGGVISAILITFSRPSPWCTIQLASLVVYVLYATRNFRVAAIAFAWVVPFALPMILMHGVFNPSFSKLTAVGNLPIALRIDGIIYASLLSTKLLAITMALALLTVRQRDDLFFQLSKIKILPRTIVVVMFQAVSMFGYLVARSKSIMMAQRLRGVPDGPSIIIKIRCLISCVVPLVAITLSEAITRANSLESRGCGSVEFNNSNSGSDDCKINNDVLLLIVTVTSSMVLSWIF